MRGVLSERVLKHSYGGSVMDKRILSTALLLGSLIAAPLVHADSPPNIKKTETHSDEAKDKGVLYRVKNEGLGGGGGGRGGGAGGRGARGGAPGGGDGGR